MTKENQKSKWIIYSYNDWTSVPKFFKTKEQLEEFQKEYPLFYGNLTSLEYMKEKNGQQDVICETDSKGNKKYYTVLTEYICGVYNETLKIWEWEYGSLKREYAAFRHLGVQFVDDIYGKVEENQQKILKLIKERRKLTSV